METLTITGTDDTPLTAYCWPAKQAASATVIIVHGMAEHARRYAAFAEQLAAAGLNVHAFDLRGHGATTAAIDHGHLDSRATWPQLLDDVEAVRAHAAEAAGELPAILFGHSLGSFIAQGVVQTRGRPWSALILSGTGTPSRVMCRLGAIVAAAESVRIDPTGRSRLMRKLTFGAYQKALQRRIHTKRTRFDWLSSVPAAVDAYIDDPQAGFDMTNTAWQCLLPGIARVRSPHARRAVPAKLPMLIAAGDDDPVGAFGRGPRALAAAYRNNGQRDVTVHIHDSARHELLHDSASETFTHDVLTWLAARGFVHVTAGTGRSTPCEA